MQQSNRSHHVQESTAVIRCSSEPQSTAVITCSSQPQSSGAEVNNSHQVQQSTESSAAVNHNH
jgi:hypothetical protein